MSNISHWKMNESEITIELNNDTKEYYLLIKTNTGYVISLKLKDSDRFVKDNFSQLNYITQKQSEVGVHFEPIHSKNLDYPYRSQS